jgi:hypothetical protein
VASPLKRHVTSNIQFQSILCPSDRLLPRETAHKPEFVVPYYDFYKESQKHHMRYLQFVRLQTWTKSRIVMTVEAHHMVLTRSFDSRGESVIGLRTIDSHPADIALPFQSNSTPTIIVASEPICYNRRCDLQPTQPQPGSRSTTLQTFGVAAGRSSRQLMLLPGSEARNVSLHIRPGAIVRRAAHNFALLQHPLIRLSRAHLRDRDTRRIALALLVKQKYIPRTRAGRCGRAAAVPDSERVAAADIRVGPVALPDGVLSRAAAATLIANGRIRA